MWTHKLPKQQSRRRQFQPRLESLEPRAMLAAGDVFPAHSPVSVPIQPDGMYAGNFIGVADPMAAAPQSSGIIGVEPIVTNPGDDGPGSLRWAILDASSISGPVTITFGPGPHWIRLNSPLPSLANQVTIDVAEGGFVGLVAGEGTGGLLGSFSSLVKNGAGTLYLGGQLDTAADPSLIVNAGTLILTQSQDFASVTVTGTAQVRLDSVPAIYLATSCLVLELTAKLDLDDNALIVHATPESRQGVMTSVHDWIALGANGLSWNGAGITSRAAARDPSQTTGLGSMLNDDGLGGAFYTQFAGRAVGANDVLVKYTHYGDADLSGQIDGTDFALVDNGFNTQSSGWFNGDFDYSDGVDGTDFVLLDNVFNSIGASLPTGGGIDPAVVPTTLTLIDHVPVRTTLVQPLTAIDVAVVEIDFAARTPGAETVGGDLFAGSAQPIDLESEISELAPSGRRVRPHMVNRSLD